jgi:hypothetical protein
MAIAIFETIIACRACMKGIQEIPARLDWACEQVTAFYFDVVCPAAVVPASNQSKCSVYVRDGRSGGRES